MLPTLKPGAVVLVDPQGFHSRKPAVGDLVVAQHPGRSRLHIVKRVAGETDAGFILYSDNAAAGTDSRTWGPVPAKLLRGRVTSLLASE